MSPFDQPPVGTPVSFEPPEPQGHGPRRGRMVAVALLTAGLIGGGIAGVSQLVSADRPDLAVGAPDDPADSVPPADDSSDDSSDEGTDESDSGEQSDVESGHDNGDNERGATGEIVIETGDGDPIVIDLGDIVDGDIGRLTECIGLPMIDFDVGAGDGGEWQSGEFPAGDLGEFFDELLEDLPFDLESLEDLDAEFGDFGPFDIDGGNVTVMGPDGVSVIDLGDNGSVTVTKENGDVTITTDGDASVSQLEDLFGEFGSAFGDDFEFGDFELDDAQIDEFLESLPSLDQFELPALDDLASLEPAEIQACLDGVLGN